MHATTDEPTPTSGPLDELARHLRSHPALRAKAQIAVVSEVLGGSSWLHGPGDDGAVVTMGGVELGGARGEVIACGEALLPAFVAADPYGAGLAAVLTNVNDLAAMGATPRAVVDTVVAARDVAQEALRGLRDGCSMYDVPLVGGHLTIHDGPPALSAFGVGQADAVLSTTRVSEGQALVVACCTAGTMRNDFPFFRSFDERGARLAGDVRVLADLARSGAAVAAKDVSMAGLVGSLAMLLEWSRLGVTVDLEALPRPHDVPLTDWLTCFPAFAFLLCAAPARETECLDAFRTRGLEAAVVGHVDGSGELTLRSGSSLATVLDLSAVRVTGLRR